VVFTVTSIEAELLASVVSNGKIPSSSLDADAKSAVYALRKDRLVACDFEFVYPTKLARAALAAFKDQMEQEASANAKLEEQKVLSERQARKDRRDKYILFVLGHVIGFIVGRFGNQLEQLIRSAYRAVASLFH